LQVLRWLIRAALILPDNSKWRQIMATQASDAARIHTIADLNDRTRLGLDRNARIVITANCLETLSGAGG
jgi:hypothetical protein